MSSGRQLSEQNVAVFTAWVASKTDHDFRALANRGVLSRKEIAIECSFAKSVLDQNPRIKAALRELEDELRTRSVLPQRVEKTGEDVSKPLMREAGNIRGALYAERLRRLETDNASLKAEVAELKRSLEKHTILSEALSLTGRVPR
jgi:hypothetical protein